MLEHELYEEQPEYQSGMQYEQARLEYEGLKRALKIKDRKGYEFIISLMDMIVAEEEE